MTAPRTADARLDAMLASLRQVEPSLDDLTRARVGAELQTALRTPVADGGRGTGRGTGPRRALVVGGVALAVAAAAVAIAFGSGWLSAGAGAGAGDSRRTGVPQARAPGAAAGEPSPRGAIDVGAGAVERVAIGTAEVTVYGPGRVSSRGSAGGVTLRDDIAVVDADAALVDRSRGDGTLVIAYGDLHVTVTRATFALDRTNAPRVTVMRGELLLRCDAGERAVRAGESATCETIARTPTPAIQAPAAGQGAAFVDGRAVAAAPRSPVRSDVDEPAAPATREPATPTDAYAEADRAMRRGDRPAARVALEALVAAQPDSRDAATALLDLARLDASYDATAARRHLDALDAHPHGAVLAEPSAHLRCTLVAADDRSSRVACLADYYRRFPDSPRAAAALARLGVLHAATDCGAAAPLLRAYLARFPDGPDHAAVSAWRDRCAAP
ncbi:MAG TPA: hypothetical protein VM261_14390 [Kofleriaceae bacterium]|nr:hypothetical protein [Kofleriaceae bacterium]